MNPWDYNELLYIYFIYSGKRLVYIGRSKHPLKRINEHRLRTFWDTTFEKAIIYGPYEKWRAYRIESYEIIKRSRSKHLISNTNNNYGYNQKVSVKDSGHKTIYHIGETGKAQKVVG